MNKNTHWKCPHCESIVKGKNYHTITEDDINGQYFTIQGKKFGSFTFGQLFSFDVGKRFYLINGLLYMENQEQYNKRIGKD